MKRKIVRIAGIVLIVVGLLFLAMPYISSYLIKLRADEASAYIHTVSAEDIERNKQQEVTFDYKDIEFINPSETFATVRNIPINFNQVIGQIVIPSLKINLTLFNGINTSNLLAGAATMKPKQTMGERNFAIASHYTPVKGALFSNLIHIETGSTVRITDKTTIYEYKVYESRIVKATDVFLVEDALATKKGKPIVSLMSCYYLNNPDKRFFAFGELVDSYPYTQEAMEALD